MSWLQLIGELMCVSASVRLPMAFPKRVFKWMEEGDGVVLVLWFGLMVLLEAEQLRVSQGRALREATLSKLGCFRDIYRFTK